MVYINILSYDIDFEITDQSVLEIFNKYIGENVELPIYIEVWDEKGFYEYFEAFDENTILEQPDGSTKHVEGWHSLDEVDDRLCHCVAIIGNKNWKETLVHEIVHINQSDKMSRGLWIVEKSKYERKNDPYEIEAINIAKKEEVNNNGIILDEKK